MTPSASEYEPEFSPTTEVPLIVNTFCHSAVDAKGIDYV